MKTGLNTDRELYRDPTHDGTENGSYYMPSLHVTINGLIGMNVGGYVVLKTIREWHALAAAELPPQGPA